jgi:hypothetical protein
MRMLLRSMSHPQPMRIRHLAGQCFKTHLAHPFLNNLRAGLDCCDGLHTGTSWSPVWRCSRRPHSPAVQGRLGDIRWAEPLMTPGCIVLMARPGCRGASSVPPSQIGLGGTVKRILHTRFELVYTSLPTGGMVNLTRPPVRLVRERDLRSPIPFFPPLRDFWGKKKTIVFLKSHLNTILPNGIQEGKKGTINLGPGSQG